MYVREELEVQEWELPRPGERMQPWEYRHLLNTAMEEDQDAAYDVIRSMHRNRTPLLEDYGLPELFCEYVEYRYLDGTQEPVSEEEQGVINLLQNPSRYARSTVRRAEGLRSRLESRDQWP